MTTAGAAARLRFGRFELQPDEHRLLVDGKPAALGGRALDLLSALAERPGQLVGKHALMDLVWPGLVVQENNLAAQISALRKVLGGDVIATIPGAASLRRADRIDRTRRSARSRAGPSTADDRPQGERPAPRTNLPAELPALLGAPTSSMRWLRWSTDIDWSASSAQASASPCWGAKAGLADASGPTTLTSRCRSTRAASASSSRARPSKAGNSAGRFVRSAEALAVMRS